MNSDGGDTKSLYLHVEYSRERKSGECFRLEAEDQKGVGRVDGMGDR